MYLKIEQILNELYKAEFNILDENEEKIGNAILVGKVGSMEANIKINIFENEICLKHEYKNIKEKLAGMFGKGIFRPYTVTINKNECGRIGIKYVKEGLNSIAVKELVLDGSNYSNYYYVTKEKGKIYSIYKNDIEISEINKSNEIINGNHIYKAKCIENKYITPTLIQCLYTHVFSYYKPGEKVITGKQTTFQKITSKLLESNMILIFGSKIRN